MLSPPSPGGATRYILLHATQQLTPIEVSNAWETFTVVLEEPTKLLLCSHVLFATFCVYVGGQCILAVDIPGPSSTEEQQGPLLSAALETQASYPAWWRTDQGTILCVCVLVSVCWCQWWQNNFSDTSYESWTSAPDSNSDLRPTATTFCVIIQHRLWYWVTDKLSIWLCNLPSVSCRWSRRIWRSTQRSLSRRIVWASPRPLRLDPSHLLNKSILNRCITHPSYLGLCLEAFSSLLTVLKLARNRL